MTPLALADPSAARSSNLAFALRCLPGERRSAALIFYRFCRAVDDLADEEALPLAVRREELNRWAKSLTTREGLPEEIEQVIRAHNLDCALLQAIVQGCLMDLDFEGFPTLDALRDYCWHVACAVGLVSIRIFGCSPAAGPFATHLGYALQFTNILRDAREDALRGRVYLPWEFLGGEHLSAEGLLAAPQKARPALERLALAAREEFSQAQAALPSQDARALLPARVMAAIYRRLLARMEAERFQTLKKPLAISRWEKMFLALRVLVGGRWPGGT